MQCQILETQIKLVPLTNPAAEQDPRELVDQSVRIKGKEVLNQPYLIQTRKVYHHKMISLCRYNLRINLEHVVTRYNVKIQVCARLNSYSNNYLKIMRIRDLNPQNL